MFPRFPLKSITAENLESLLTSPKYFIFFSQFFILTAAINTESILTSLYFLIVKTQMLTICLDLLALNRYLIIIGVVKLGIIQNKIVEIYLV